MIALAPLRLVLVFAVTGICGTFGLLLRLFGTSPARTIAITSHKLWAPAVLRICWIRLTSTGLENIPNEPAIFCANHASYLDIPAVCAATTQPLFFIAKASLRQVPFLGWYMRATGMIFIERGNRDAAQASMHKAAQLIGAGKCVLSFPEGTRTADGGMGMFRRGSFTIAQAGNLPIVPTAIAGTQEALPKGSWIIRSTDVQVSFGKPVIPTDHPDDSVEALASRIRTEVEGLLNQC